MVDDCFEGFYKLWVYLFGLLNKSEHSVVAAVRCGCCLLDVVFSGENKSGNLQAEFLSGFDELFGVFDGGLAGELAGEVVLVDVEFGCEGAGGDPAVVQVLLLVFRDAGAEGGRVFGVSCGPAWGVGMHFVFGRVLTSGDFTW